MGCRIAAIAVVCAAAMGMTAGTAAAGRPSDVAPYVAVVRLSKDLLSPLTSRQIHNRAPVRQVVLGTRATGTAWTDGQVSVRLDEGHRPLRFTVVFHGTTVARTVGYNGPAIIHSVANTRFTATKTVDFDIDRGFFHSRARIAARTNVTTTGIQSTLPGLRGCLVRWVASKRVNSTRAQVNAIASQNAHQRIVASFDAEVTGVLERVNGDLRSLGPALASIFEGEQKPVVDFWHSNGHILVCVARSPQTHYRPQLPHQDLDPSLVQIWLHETLWGHHRNATEGPWTEVVANLRQMYRTIGIRFHLPRGTPGLVALTDRWVVIGLGDERDIQDRQTNSVQTGARTSSSR
jgi:hypothetical protein